jgi:hypothetical protein
MRVLTACLLGSLGLGAFALLAACSDSTDMGSGGAAGASGAHAAGGGGKAPTAGASNTAGTGGDAGAGDGCGFATDTCQTCLLIDHCTDQVVACSNDTDACAPALQTLPNCVCGSSSTADECQAKFVTEGGDKALSLAECYSLNCETACK